VTRAARRAAAAQYHGYRGAQKNNECRLAALAGDSHGYTTAAIGPKEIPCKLTRLSG
jgi:hypothetical protein